jgi:hypothetical protein
MLLLSTSQKQTDISWTQDDGGCEQLTYIMKTELIIDEKSEQQTSQKQDILLRCISVPCHKVTAPLHGTSCTTQCKRSCQARPVS